MLKEYLDMATILGGAKTNEEIANKLKEFGVLCPPCKVGDMVYVIHENKVRRAVVLAFYIDKVGIICDLKISINGENPTAPCCAAIIDTDTYTDSDIYLTNEEAEKALMIGKRKKQKT